MFMHALFIGHSYIDVTFVTKHFPTGDEKALGENYAFGIGGNAMVAAFAFAKLGRDAHLYPHLIAPIAPDWLGDMMLRKCADYGIVLFPRRVGKSSLSLVLPNNGKRAIVRCRDDNYLEDGPKLILDEGCKLVHIDGHQPQTALYYVQEARKKGILTSLDGGSVRANTAHILPFVDVAVVSERFCQQMGKSTEDMITHLVQTGVKVAAVTLGEQGVFYAAEETGFTIEHIPACHVPPEKVIDTTGAGDIFHGAYAYSYATAPQKTWRQHFEFAKFASALSVQVLGAENSIPTLHEVQMQIKSHTL